MDKYDFLGPKKHIDHTMILVERKQAVRFKGEKSRRVAGNRGDVKSLWIGSGAHVDQFEMTWPPEEA